MLNDEKRGAKLSLSLLGPALDKRPQTADED